MKTPQLGSALAWLVVVWGTSAPLACTTQEAVSDDDDGGSANADSNSGGSGYACCLNGTGYTCPDASSFDRCNGGFDLGACMDGCGETDFECFDACIMQQENVQHDPSGCSLDAGACSMTGNGDNSDECAGIARPCDLDLDCCSDFICVDLYGDGDKTCTWP